MSVLYPNYFPVEVWHMGPETFSDIQEIIMEAGYGNGDYAAVNIARKYGKKLFTTYEIKVHFDWLASY